MLELTDWMASADLAPRPWLIVGKGPTFDRRGDYDLREFNVLSLNHVVAEMPVDVAHIIDIDVVGDCADRLEQNCRWLLMPRHPNVQAAPGTAAIEEYFRDLPVLARLADQGRLVWYNLARTPVHGRSPVIGVKYFSSEAALAILARMGVKTVRSLGVDGGNSYASAFAHLDGTTLLSNGRATFNVQFDRLALISAEYDVDYRPLVEPFRIFIGTDESQIVAHRVLEYSIRKSASIPVEVVPMLDFATPMPESEANRPRVSFTFTRFLIPELCGFHGRALYLDADMLVLGDITELADLPFGGRSVLCTNQPEPPAAWRNHAAFHPGRHSAVLLLDCARLPWNVVEIVKGLDEGRYTYEQLVFDLCPVPPDDIGDTIPIEWNHLERYDPDATRLLHYTVVPTQPWKSEENPLGELWMSWYREAVEAGAVPPEEVEDLVAKGLVKRSLGAALGLAPSRRSTTTNASLDLAMARHRILELEDRIDHMRNSPSWRVGESIVRPLRKVRSVARRGQSLVRRS